MNMFVDLIQFKLEIDEDKRFVLMYRTLDVYIDMRSKAITAHMTTHYENEFDEPVFELSYSEWKPLLIGY